MTLAELTDQHLVRLHERLWERMTAGDGYQPFGYDRNTLWLTHPVWMHHLDAVRREARRRRDAGAWTLPA